MAAIHGGGDGGRNEAVYSIGLAIYRDKYKSGHTGISRLLDRSLRNTKREYPGQCDLLSLCLVSYDLPAVWAWSTVKNELVKT